MNSSGYDVIIAGAGPSGSMAGYYLAKSGFKVLILEKSVFPRYKVCGGGLTHKIIAEIPFDLSAVIETTIHSICFSNNFSSVFARSSSEPLMYCTMRETLDQFLLQQAVNVGVKVGFMQQVTNVEENQEGITVYTKTANFQSRLVIGADGPSSIVARISGLRKNISQGLAWEAEIYTNPAILEKYSDTVFLDWGTFPGGYGWVFPKKDHFSIGVGGPATLSKQMMPYYQRFLKYLDFDTSYRGGEGFITQSIKSWPIPVKTKKGNVHSGRIMVVGDAAGFADSLTGEGIYYAVMSGKLAASSSIAFLQGKTENLQSYSDQVNDLLLEELLEGEKIKHIFNTVPLRIHCFVRDNDRAWRALGKVLRGERSYRDVKLGFGKWSIFWNLASFLAKIIAGWKEKNFRKSTP